MRNTRRALPILGAPVVLFSRRHAWLHSLRFFSTTVHYSILSSRVLNRGCRVWQCFDAVRAAKNSPQGFCAVTPDRGEGLTSRFAIPTALAERPARTASAQRLPIYGDSPTSFGTVG